MPHSILQQPPASLLACRIRAWAVLLAFSLLLAGCIDTTTKTQTCVAAVDGKRVEYQLVEKIYTLTGIFVINQPNYEYQTKQALSQWLQIHYRQRTSGGTTTRTIDGWPLAAAFQQLRKADQPNNSDASFNGSALDPDPTCVRIIGVSGSFVTLVTVGSRSTCSEAGSVSRLAENSSMPAPVPIDALSCHVYRQFELDLSSRIPTVRECSIAPDASVGSVLDLMLHQ